MCLHQLYPLNKSSIQLVFFTDVKDPNWHWGPDKKAPLNHGAVVEGVHKAWPKTKATKKYMDHQLCFAAARVSPLLTFV